MEILTSVKSMENLNTIVPFQFNPDRDREKMQIALQGKAACRIVTQPGATVVEFYAAEELKKMLQQITGANFDVGQSSDDNLESVIVIGPGPLAQSFFPEIRLETFREEQLTMRIRGGRLLLAGGRPRGTLYAVYRFLQEACGVRWWAPWATHVPQDANLAIDSLQIEETPAFESRNVYWFSAFDRDWAVRNGLNAVAPKNVRLREEHGGCITYAAGEKGFHHTFFELVPPEEYFEKHPEWFSLINGQRRHPEGGKHRSQLCTTNPELRDFLIRRLREWLKESPGASSVSISQDDTFADWGGACQCPACKAIDDREGSFSGSIIALLNHIAERLGPEFPGIGFDTLAYRYTRQAPRTLKPLPNVIVRLCSIECNVAAPLDDSSNRAFAQDIKDWSRICDRLYVWDYTTNFIHYLLPHPNWFSLGPNMRFFHQHNVRGIFAQGAFQSCGAEMAELRAWMLARLMWNPYQDELKLIDEFLCGYYGRAADVIRQYLDLLRDATKGFYMNCYAGLEGPYLKFETLNRAEHLWQAAEDVVKNDPDLLWRVRQGHLPVLYAFLIKWAVLQAECLSAGATWPLPHSRQEVADAWLATATGSGPQGWSPMMNIREGEPTKPQDFVVNFGADFLDPVPFSADQHARESVAMK